MSLEKCKSCGQQVSTIAKACPHCGRQMISAFGFIWRALVVGSIAYYFYIIMIESAVK